jgi:hypothetical protein
MDSFLQTVEAWLEHSKLPTVIAGVSIIIFALWNIWRARK